MAVEPDSNVEIAESRMSSLSPDCRLLASGPWHAKHLLDRSGRISRLNPTEWSLAHMPSVSVSNAKTDAMETMLVLFSLLFILNPPGGIG